MSNKIDVDSIMASLPEAAGKAEENNLGGQTLQNHGGALIQTLNIDKENPLNKVSLSLFVPSPSSEVETEVNGVSFKIKPDIPYEEILIHIQWALMLITDSNGYISFPVKIACEELVLCAAFTNLDFRRLELSTIEASELYEMYDIIKKSGILSKVKETVNIDQLDFYHFTLDKTLESILNYRNSVAGMVELLSSKNEELKNAFGDTLADFNDPTKIENVLKIAELMQSQNAIK